MPKVVIEWMWEEAFERHGFGDGDSWNGTRLVEEEIKRLGYEVDCDSAGIHNFIIVAISRGTEQWVNEKEEEPRKWLPEALVKALDETFNDAYMIEESNYE